MGRSKFPGKPSKHVNRKRVNVLPPALESVAESSGAMTVESSTENKQPPEETEPRGGLAKLRRRLNRKLGSSKVLCSSNKRGLLSKMCSKGGGVKGNAVVKRKPKYKTICRAAGAGKEAANLVGKFVLPTRSVHSSRVIKPNKRFINVELGETLTLKAKKVINKRRLKEERQEEMGEEAADGAPLPAAVGRVVLRQARLKLSQTPSGPEGPFSGSSTTCAPPGTVTCGVCGAVRFYRFVKQARKFNIYSCESCRKFISKMIKRQSCGKGGSTLVCHKGQGTCHVPPIVRSQQMKLIRCAYKSRCPACWLKMCLRSFQMPMSLKHGLVQMLPKNMQSSELMFSSPLPLLWQPNVEKAAVSAAQPSDAAPAQAAAAAATTSVKLRPVRFKNVRTATPQQHHHHPPAADIKRHKIDLRGPRVKHVCRSASIVLGQALATFPGGGVEPSKKPEPTPPDRLQPKVPSPHPPKPEACTIEMPLSKAAALKNEFSFSESESSDSDKLPQQQQPPPPPPPPLKLPLVNEAIIKRDKSHRILESKLVPSERRRPVVPEPQNTISIDYWENYDSNDIAQNGFCLIASQQFPISAICFLCGSAGGEALLHCSLCCEPYHPFCLEQSPPVVNNSNKQFVWLCPRCTTCTRCNQTDRQKFNCQKCSKAYHPECINTKWADDDRPLVCSKCLTCKSCGREDTTRFIGNLPLCTMCFKLRKKDSQCPVCNNFFEDSDSDVKMMECTRCNKWIHAKCEGLSEEYYHILTNLPESIKYLCCLCSAQSTPHWRKALRSELKFNFNHVLRLLSKNKEAKELLKLSPAGNHAALNKTISTVRRLQFSDNEDSSTADELLVDEFEKKLITEYVHLVAADEKTARGLTMQDVKRKINLNEYTSIRDFDREMEEAINQIPSVELFGAYRAILLLIFPWYKPESQCDDVANVNFCSKDDDEILSTHVENAAAVDSRFCSFCKVTGDRLNHLESRLIYCGYNEWVHVNCAIWSSEVYEDIDGSLQNVHGALSRGRLIRCSYCKQKGATVGCCYKNCYETYHFLCARNFKCHFMHDKTVFCSSHPLDETTLNVITTPVEFNVRRSVFVELSNNSRRTKTFRSDSVTLMIGSLCVTNLGKINPLVSDQVDAIVPTGYVCSRLFWSTVEPWKLMSYKISTSVQNSHFASSFVDKNFTVDHSLSKSMIERKLKEVLLWQKDSDKKKSDVLNDFEDEEEPQKADLLSPEITDAIFEELPHELLDGISVQDIFPKFEDFISSENSDLKTDPEIDEFDELKKQRCSLTLSCKLDNAYAPAVKKRKITAPRDNNRFFQLLQVDGNFDDGSSSSECDSPTGEDGGGGCFAWNSVDEPVMCERCHCTYRTQASYKRHLDTCEMICTSESDSEINQDQDHDNGGMSQQQVNIMESSTVLINNDTPVLYESYQNEIHSVLNTQTFVTSKSTELISMPVEQEQQQQQHHHHHHHHHHQISNNEAELNASTQFCINQNSPTICVNPTPTMINTTTPNMVINNPVMSNPMVNTGSMMNANAVNTIPMMNNHNQLQAITIQPQLEYQQPAVTVQPLQYNHLMPNHQITLQAANQNVLNSMMAQRWMKPVAKPQMGKAPKAIINRNRRTILTKRNQFDDNMAAPVILQQLPSTANFIPTFIDGFQQSNGQNVQYVATIGPQIQSQPQLVQLQADNNLISLMPAGMQPTTMIIQQQPRVLENQLVLDSNGSLSWAQPATVQPVYYGFETIVQNTVMQSQQFLPTTVPGVLTANSSYSTTTQVFQTSKLEPVLDVSTNSFVLVNSGLAPAPQQPQAPAPPPPPQPQSIDVPQPQQYLPQVKPYQAKYAPHRPAVEKLNSTSTLNNNNNNNNNSITLPKAPFVSEQRIPTNIVTPTPKLPTPIQSRPMSRVLPMQTLKEAAKKPEIIVKEMKIIKPAIIDDFEITAKSCATERPKVKEQFLIYKEEKKVTARTTLPPPQQPPQPHQPVVKPSAADYRTSTFKISPVQVAPLKPIKSYPPLPSPAPSLVLPPAPAPPPTPPSSPPPLPPPPPPPQPSMTLPPKMSTQLPLNVNRQQQEKKIEPQLPKQQLPPQEKKDNENVPAILYTIETQDGFRYTSTSVADLWTKVFEAVQNARAAHNMPPLPSDSTNIMNSLQVLGLKSSGLKYLIEQLPGASKCIKYKPQFGFPPTSTDVDEEPVGHSYGCVRCVPNIKRNDQYDLFGWLASKHRNPEHSLNAADVVSRRGSANSLPMAMRFRQLKSTSKNSLGVYRSRIHRRGLFCLRDFEAGDMVIEYAGEVIRSVLTDKREKFYNSKGIGCYMFRIDDNLVVDATMTGNAARFINHSCDPNCYSKVVEILGHKHIIIFALRKIICGEELTYDYKFPIEEDKIPCSCGTRRCRKFLN